MTNQKLRSYCDRLIRLYDERDELSADIKDLEAEIRVEAGMNVKALRKWVNAERKDKVDKVVAEVADDVAYGEMLGHEISNGSKVTARTPSKDSKQDPPHDPETGEIIERDTREDRSGTARKAPSTLGVAASPSGVQPAGPYSESGAGHAEEAAVGDHAGDPAPQNTGGHRQGTDLSTAPVGSGEPQSVEMASHTCEAGAGDRPMRAARPTDSNPGVPQSARTESREAGGDLRRPVPAEATPADVLPRPSTGETAANDPLELGRWDRSKWVDGKPPPAEAA